MTTAIVKLPEIQREIAIPERWVVKRNKTLDLARVIKSVSYQGDFDDASDALARITKCSNELEKERKTLVKPLNAATKAIKALCDREREALEVEKKRLKGLLADYAEAQARKAAQERRKAEEEARKEAERQFAEQEAAQAKADLFGGEPEPVREVIEVAAPPPGIEEAHSSSSRVVKRLTWEVVDEEAIPRAFLMLDQRKVNEYLRMQKAAIMDALEKGTDGKDYVPGIKFQIKTDVMGR